MVERAHRERAGRRRSGIRSVRTTISLLLGLALGLPADATTFTSFNMIAFPGPSGTQTRVLGINDSGQIVGYYSVSTQQHGFLYDGTTYTTIDPFGSSNTGANGINDAGQIVGSYRLAAGTGHGYLFDGTTYTSFDAPGTFTRPSGINDAGQIVGVYGSVFGFLKDGTTYTSIDADPGTRFTTSPQGINDAGQIVGFITDSQPNPIERHGFLFDGTAYTTFDAPGTGTEAYGINDAGQIVGCFTDPSSGMTRGFLKDGLAYFVIDVPGARNTCLAGINDVGEVVGTFTDASGRFFNFSGTFLIPEPSTALLVAAGLAVLAVRRRSARASITTHEHVVV